MAKHKKQHKPHGDNKHTIFADPQSDKELKTLTKEYNNALRKHNKVIDHIHDLKKKMYHLKKNGKHTDALTDSLNEKINSLNEKADEFLQVTIEKQKEVQTRKHVLGISTRDSSSPSTKYGF